MKEIDPSDDNIGSLDDLPDGLMNQLTRPLNSGDNEKLPSSFLNTNQTDFYRFFYSLANEIMKLHVRSFFFYFFQCIFTIFQLFAANWYGYLPDVWTKSNSAFSDIVIGFNSVLMYDSSNDPAEPAMALMIIPFLVFIYFAGLLVFLFITFKESGTINRKFAWISAVSFQVLLYIVFLPLFAAFGTTLRFLADKNATAIVFFVLYIFIFFFAIILISYVTKVLNYCTNPSVSYFSSYNGRHFTNLLIFTGVTIVLANMSQVFEDWFYVVAIVVHILFMVYLLYDIFGYPIVRLWTMPFLAAFYATSIVTDVLTVITIFTDVISDLIRFLVPIAVFVIASIIFFFYFRSQINRISYILDPNDIALDEKVRYIEAFPCTSVREATKYLHIGLSLLKPAILDSSLGLILAERFDNFDFWLQVAQIAAFIPCNTQQLHRCLQRLVSMYSKSIPTQILIERLVRIEQTRASIAAQEVESHLEMVKMKSDDMINAIKNFWHQISNGDYRISLHGINILAASVSSAKTSWNEAISLYPNDPQITAEYSNFLIEGLGKFENGIIWKIKSGHLERGFQSGLDHVFRAFVVSMPTIWKEKMVDKFGNLSRDAQLDVTSHTTTQTTTAQEKLEEDLEVGMLEQLAVQMFDWPHLRMSLSKATSHYRPRGLFFVRFLKVLAFLAWIGLLLATTICYDDSFNTININQQLTETFVTIRVSLANLRALLFFQDAGCNDNGLYDMGTFNRSFPPEALNEYVQEFPPDHFDVSLKSSAELALSYLMRFYDSLAIAVRQGANITSKSFPFISDTITCKTRVPNLASGIGGSDAVEGGGGGFGGDDAQHFITFLMQCLTNNTMKYEIQQLLTNRSLSEEERSQKLKEKFSTPGFMFMLNDQAVGMLSKYMFNDTKMAPEPASPKDIIMSLLFYYTNYSSGFNTISYNGTIGCREDGEFFRSIDFGDVFLDHFSLSNDTDRVLIFYGEEALRDADDIHEYIKIFIIIDLCITIIVCLPLVYLPLILIYRESAKILKALEHVKPEAAKIAAQRLSKMSNQIIDYNAVQNIKSISGQLVIEILIFSILFIVAIVLNSVAYVTAKEKTQNIAEMIYLSGFGSARDAVSSELFGTLVAFAMSRDAAVHSNILLFLSSYLEPYYITLVSRLQEYHKIFFEGVNGMDGMGRRSAEIREFHNQERCGTDLAEGQGHQFYSCLALDRLLSTYLLYSNDFYSLAKSRKGSRYMNTSQLINLYHLKTHELYLELSQSRMMMSQLIHGEIDDNSALVTTFLIIAIVLIAVNLFFSFFIEITSMKSLKTTLLLLKHLPPPAVAENSGLVNILLVKKAKKEEELYDPKEIVFNKTQSPIICVGDSFVIETINTAFKKTYDFSNEQIVGKKLTSIIEKPANDDKEKTIEEQGQLRMYEKMQLMVEHDEDLQCNYPIACINGTGDPVKTMVNAFPVHDRNNHISNFILFIDNKKEITDIENKLEAAKNDSENLMTRMIPQEVRSFMSDKSEDYVFSTKMATLVSIKIPAAMELLDSIDSIYSSIEIISREHPPFVKVKTIYDTIVFAGGLFNDEEDNGHANIAIDFAKQLKEELPKLVPEKEGITKFQIALLSGGPLICGIDGDGKAKTFTVIGKLIDDSLQLASSAPPEKIIMLESTKSLLSEERSEELVQGPEALNQQTFVI